ncbi:bifunctional UDP-N-acetylglucosamine diphosphorylase/glucosamine-1-phosphate N-acetyltransferase GlmU, partial [Rhizobium ruizarguesonis]
LVVGLDAEDVSKAASVAGVSIESYLQKERLCTGHAVLAAREAISKGYDDILFTYGDVPLQTDGPLKAAQCPHEGIVRGFGDR